MAPGRHTRQSTRRALRRGAALSLLSLALAGGLGVAVFADDASTTTTTTSTTTTTTPPPEAAQAGWVVVARSPRGVLSDRTTEVVNHATFIVARFRARTTVLHWHAGSEDPPSANIKMSPDSRHSIDFASEGVTGVVGVFNGAFKADSLAGGTIANGLSLAAMKPGVATAAIDVHGKLTLGVWGKDLPNPSVNAIVFRQNLGLLVNGGVVTTPAKVGSPYLWGAPLKGVVREPRTALGVDANSNILYVASEDAVLPSELAQALVLAGAQRAMELDMNPYWPILGMATKPLTSPAMSFTYSLPGQQHSARVYINGWTRDFFVVSAEPSSWTCSLRTVGIAKFGILNPQPFTLTGTNCPTPKG